MIRRALLFASVVALPMWAGLSSAAHGAHDVQLIYIGAQDCPPCQRWRADAHPRWLASSDFQKVDYSEIEPITLKDSYDELSWPRGVGPVLAQVQRKSGTPRYLIVQKGRIVSNHLGLSAWASTLTDLRQYLE